MVTRRHEEEGCELQPENACMQGSEISKQFITYLPFFCKRGWASLEGIQNQERTGKGDQKLVPGEKIRKWTSESTNCG